MHTITLVAGKEFHTHKGSIAHDDLIGTPGGRRWSRPPAASTYLALRPLLADFVLSMPRGAAVVYPKDAGADRRTWPTSSPAPASSRPGSGRVP